MEKTLGNGGVVTVWRRPFHTCGEVCGGPTFSLQIAQFRGGWHSCSGLWRGFDTVVFSAPHTCERRDSNNLEHHPTEPTAESLWDDVASRLRGALNEKTFGNWFSEVTPLGIDDDVFVLGVPNDFAREWIEGHFVELIRAAMKDATGSERRLRLAVRPETPAPAAVLTLDSAVAEAPVLPPRSVDGIKPKYTFDSFVIGSSNRFAHAAALAVAEAPAQAYNPLFIYGHTGLGKTHLLHAVANYVGSHSANMSVRYVSSETFVNDFINSLRDKRIEGFKQRYRTYDVLLIDDVQFFEHKERIQEEFFHTFNSLHEAGRQIVMSSDRPPRDIAALEERLRSRFEWGLITDIQPPDLETRIAILRRKVKYDQIGIDDDEVLTVIASQVSTNIRELEGALTRVVAFSSLTGRRMDVELAQDVLRDVYPQDGAAEVSIDRIQRLVCDRFGVSFGELTGDRRSQNIVYPRQVAMYLSRELTDSSLPKIGKEFGGRDHTTVIHATSKIARLIREDRNVYNLVQELTARIKQAR
jgi:chromosomal replication initiator protein